MSVRSLTVFPFVLGSFNAWPVTASIWPASWPFSLTDKEFVVRMCPRSCIHTPKDVPLSAYLHHVQRPRQCWTSEVQAGSVSGCREPGRQASLSPSITQLPRNSKKTIPLDDWSIARFLPLNASSVFFGYIHQAAFIPLF